MSSRRQQNPWALLRARPHLTLIYDDLLEVDGCLRGDTIILRSDLDQRQRNAVLMHELVHDERRVMYPHAPEAVMEHEEEQVRREVVRRLVPSVDLAAFLARQAHGVTPLEVADEFEVPEWLARDALRLLRVLRAA